MANRGTPQTSNSFALDSATDLFARASLVDPGGSGSSAGGGAGGNPSTSRARSYPIIPNRGSRGGAVGGLAPKRAKPTIKLSDINGDFVVGGGAAGAGLGAGRPNLA